MISPINNEKTIEIKYIKYEKRDVFVLFLMKIGRTIWYF